MLSCGLIVLGSWSWSWSWSRGASSPHIGGLDLGRGLEVCVLGAGLEITS